MCMFRRLMCQLQLITPSRSPCQFAQLLVYIYYLSSHSSAQFVTSGHCWYCSGNNHWTSVDCSPLLYSLLLQSTCCRYVVVNKCESTFCCNQQTRFQSFFTILPTVEPHRWANKAVCMAFLLKKNYMVLGELIAANIQSGCSRKQLLYWRSSLYHFSSVLTTELQWLSCENNIHKIQFQTLNVPFFSSWTLF